MYRCLSLCIGDTSCVCVCVCLCVSVCVLPWCTVDQAAPQIRLNGWESRMLWNSDAPCAGREAASDVFLDGLNNECLKRQLGPQLPNLPRSSVLTCSSGARLEKPGEEESVFTRATCCLCRRLSPGTAKDHWDVSSGFSRRLRLLKPGEEIREKWVRSRYVAGFQRSSSCLYFKVLRLLSF